MLGVTRRLVMGQNHALCGNDKKFLPPTITDALMEFGVLMLMAQRNSCIIQHIGRLVFVKIPTGARRGRINNYVIEDDYVPFGTRTRTGIRIVRTVDSIIRENWTTTKW